ncbi:MAG: glycosyltransferase family 39 protein [Chloroflexi bacterium]|nr:glycosyltransferase family 39 protein [Chloroflexota bacterium]
MNKEEKIEQSPPSNSTETEFWRLKQKRFQPEFFWLLLILGLALSLRLFRLDYRSVWYDESFSIILARQDLATLIAGTAHDYHPPLFYLVLSLWMKLFGEGIYVTRLLSLLFGMGTILLVYQLAKTLFGPKTALLGAFLAAVAPFQLLYSQEVRMYSLQILLGAWLCLTFYQAYRRDSREEWVLFGVAALLSLYNLYFSLFGVVALDLFFVILMLYNWRVLRVVEKSKIRHWLVTNLVVALLYLPWLFILLGQVGRIKKSYWITLPNPLEIFRLLDVFLYNATNLTVDPPYDLIGLLLAVFLLIFMLQTLRYRLRRGERGDFRRSLEIAMLLTYWLGPVLLVLMVSYLFAPVYLERSLIAFAVPCYILLARVVQTARHPNFWPLLLVPGAVLVLVSLYFYFFSQDYTIHYDSTSATAYISQNYRQGDIVIHTNKLSYLPFIYLKAPGLQFVVPEEPGNPHDDLSPETQRAIGLDYVPVEQAIEKAGPSSRVWLVLTPPQPGQTDYQRQVVKGFLDRHYSLSASQSFYGLLVLLYSPTPKQ